jgi:hypothetical protein
LLSERLLGRWSDFRELRATFARLRTVVITGGDAAHREHLAVLGDIFSCHNFRAEGGNW